jgi:hypothetical protein
VKCYICILHGADLDTLTNDRNWPPNAITTVAGTAVCAEHVSHVANHQVMSAIGMQSLPQNGMN